MKKLVVNQDACVGCGACTYADSEHFALDDNGLSYVTSQENIETNNVESAIEGCPTSAISIEESDCHCDNCQCEEGE